MKKTLLSLGIAFLGISASSYAQTTILSQDFEAPGTAAPALPSGWSQGSTGTPGWFTSTNAGTTWGSLTNYYNIPAHTQYVVVDDAANPTPSNLHDTLKSPIFTAASTTYLNFDYFFFNAYLSSTGQEETCYILGSSNGGSTWTLIDSLGGNAFDGTDTWANEYINLSTLSGSNCQIGFAYSDGGATILGCALDNIKVFSPASSDLGITGLSTAAGAPNSYGATNGTYSLQGTVENYGANTVTSFDITYQLGSGTPVTSTISGVNILPFTTYTFTEAVALPGTTGSNPIITWVTVPNDADLSNDSASASLITVSHMPTKRVMFEEATGTWCGWCVRGLVYMDSLFAAHPTTANIVSVHDSDPMSEESGNTSDYDNFISNAIGHSYPNMYIDRTYVTDPQNVFIYHDALLSYFGYADISMTANSVSGGVGATVNVTPAINLNGDYRLVLVVSEDSVHKSNSTYVTHADSIWLQHNYYSSQVSSQTGTYQGELTYQGTDYYSLPYEIPGVNFPFVGRYTVPDMSTSPNGVANSLPNTMTAGTTYSYTFDPVTIASDWSVKNLRLTAMLIDNNQANSTYGHVLNSVNTIWPLGVANVTAGINGVRLFPNPAMQETNLTFSLQQSSNVQVQVYDELGRAVYTIPSQNMTAGDQRLTINTANLASGVYNVRLQTENGAVTERLSVIR